jgi:hypothetical protein
MGIDRHSLNSKRFKTLQVKIYQRFTGNLQ